MNKNKIIRLVFGEGTPKNIVYMTIYQNIYLKIIDSVVDEWCFVELPSSEIKLSSLLAAIKNFARHRKIPISVKIDKTKVMNGIVVLWWMKKHATS